MEGSSAPVRVPSSGRARGSSSPRFESPKLSAWPVVEGVGKDPGDEPLNLDEEAKRPRYRILLVDDDPATLMAMKRHLLRMRGPVAYQGTLRSTSRA